MRTERRYEDPCGTARALDVIGERWALLVVRELIFGPKRFSQLRRGLAGISPNVLSQRLRDLQGAGVVRRGLMDRPADVAIYELTGRGRALEPILLELGRWGSQEPLTTTNPLSVDGLLFALKTVFDPSAAVDGVYALEVDGDWFRVTVADSAIDIVRTRTDHADVTFKSDAATLRSVAFGRQTAAAAERDGRLVVGGDRGMARRFPAMFPVPSGQTPDRRRSTIAAPHPDPVSGTSQTDSGRSRRLIIRDGMPFA
jgi:DNA-binding HxlR family transcriptional regulator